MVICCVPKCGTDSWKCDTSVTFHDFPSNPDLAAKWIKQINIALKPRPMWFPRGRPVICSKHFLQTDFKGNTDALRPRCVPTIFGHKYIGENAQVTDPNTLNNPKSSPLIVKVIKPEERILESNSTSQTSEVNSQVKLFNTYSRSGNEHNRSTNENFQVLSQQASVSSNNHYLNNTLRIESNSSQYGQLNKNDATFKNSFKKIVNQPTSLLKNVRKKEKASNDLIEIGPNTFLKINPDIIKVNKKLTPSGNTVLQFLMDPKHANAQSGDLLPKIIQGISTLENGSHTNGIEVQSAANIEDKDSSSDNQPKDKIVQHVLGHLVDTHVCEESCADLKLIKEENDCMDDSLNNENENNHMSLDEDSENQGKINSLHESSNTNLSSSTVTSFLQKAPVLLTTNMPISHCFMDKPKYILQLKQKNRQIASLKFKVSNLSKKIEELEDRCIVQERQLSYAFIKRLRTIRKNATKGDPTASYILEQIRSYTNNSKMRWSDSTLTQCAIWCRKAPYAYEYFKKAKLFNLPCLGTVKRFIKKHPELKFQKQNINCNPDDEGDSSSDFDFDESDNQNGINDFSDEENDEHIECETILSVPSDQVAEESEGQFNEKESDENCKAVENIASQSPKYQNEFDGQNNTICDNMTNKKSPETAKSAECNEIPLTVDSSNLELQEIILPSGEVVQCYSSSISSGTEVGSQYFIIPNVGDQNTIVDHEYSVVQADSLPVILQNLEHSQLHLQQQDQLIFIANSADQVECSETEVTTA